MQKFNASALKYITLNSFHIDYFNPINFCENYLTKNSLSCILKLADSFSDFVLEFLELIGREKIEIS